MVEETTPISYFYAEDGKALFKYSMVIGVGVSQHGVLVSPSFLTGRDVELSVVFSNPLQHFSPADDEFRFELGLGYRGKDKIDKWVGGLLESVWTSGGGWNPKWQTSAIQVDVDTFTKLETDADEATYFDKNAFVVTVKGNVAQAAFNGIRVVQAEFDDPRGNQIAMWVKAYRRNGGGLYTSFPVIEKVFGRSLGSGLSQPVKDNFNEDIPYVTDEAHFYRIPIRELRDAGKIKQVGPRLWEFLEETTVQIDGSDEFVGSKGAVYHMVKELLPEYPHQLCKMRY